MSDTLSGAAGSPSGEMAIPLPALRALAELPGLACGVLSPLSRIGGAGTQVRRDLLISTIEEMTGPWEWSLPALIQPRLSVAILLGDCETSMLGQCIWPDSAGRGPGFRGQATPDSFKLAGPVSLEGVQQTLLDFLALGSVGETEPLRLSLDAEQFWLLLAIADAYRSSSLRRRLAREGGRPLGVTAMEVAASWETGLNSPNPGWSVSLFSLLAPTSVPGGFQARVPGLLASVARAGLLEPLGGDGVDASGESYIFGDSIEQLCMGLSGPTINFGVTVQRQHDDRIEIAMIGGWRTAGAIAVVDLSGLERGGVEVLVAGPHFVVDLLDSVLQPSAGDDGGESGAAFAMETPFNREAILARLRSMPAVPSAAPVGGMPTKTAAVVHQPVCPSCGADLKPGARFCASCGATVAAIVAPQAMVCPTCSARNKPNARFCRECGRSLVPSSG